jgi:hypothetical protein
MSAIVQPSDFVGKHAISTDMFTNQNFVLAINEIETNWLNKLLGTSLATLFLADLLNGVPQSARFLAIYNAIVLSDECIDESYSSGMKDLFKGIVYYTWQKKNPLQSTTIGQVNTVATNSAKPSFTSSIVVSIYNEAINNYKVIQSYIKRNSSTYPEFNGINENYSQLF